MKKRFVLFVLFFQSIIVCFGQSGIYTSQAIKLSPEDVAYPQRIDVLVGFNENSNHLEMDNIDLLDSVYRLSFAENNHFLYKITINGYDDGKAIDETNNTLAQDRADVVYTYFKNRCKSDFLIRIAPNKIYNSCSGDGKEMIRYQVPTDINWLHLNNLPEKDKKFRNISLAGKVWISFVNDREACVGIDTICYVPPVDMKVNSFEASVSLLKGAFVSIKNSRAGCPADLVFRLEEYLDFKQILDNYFLVPHEKQIIAQAGYLVLESNYKTTQGACREILPNGIKVRVPASEKQMETKLRFYAKSYSEKGVEYKSLATKKIKTKTGNFLEATIGPSQIDTIYLGARITNDEIDKYFHKAAESDYSVIKIKGKNYKPFKIGKSGEYVLKKDFENLFNKKDDSPQMEEPVKDKKKSKKKRQDNDDEELE